MNETTKRQQVIDQCKAIVFMAESLAKIHRDYFDLFESGLADDLIDLVGDRTAELMEKLGDTLNGLDAAEEGDSWMEPIFERAREIFPRPKIEF